MPRFLAALVLVLLAAGCLSQPAAQMEKKAAASSAPQDPFHPPLATPLSGARSAPTPGSEIVVAQPGFAEPNVAAAYDGTTLYIGNPGDSWRSDDAGKTWKHPANTGIEGGGDGDLAVDAAGTLYYLGLSGKQGRAIPFLVSHDKGESWSPAVDVSAKSGIDREWIDVTPDSKVFGTWRGKSGIEFNRSMDGGASWLPQVVTVATDGDGGPIVHDPTTGALVIPVIDQAGLVDTAKPVSHVYTSRDNGTSWSGVATAVLPRTSPVEPNGYASDFPVISIDGAGTYYLVYSMEHTGLPVAPPEEVALYGIFVQVSKDHGATWTQPRLLSDPSKDARFPWIAAGAPGRVAVVWYENVNGVPGEMLPDQWNVKLYESLDADQAAPTGPAVTLTKTPNHLGALCTSGTGCLAADRSMLDFFEVALGLDGQPIVAYASSTLGTGVGIAVKNTEIRFVTASGPSLV